MKQIIRLVAPVLILAAMSFGQVAGQPEQIEESELQKSAEAWASEVAPLIEDFLEWPDYLLADVSVHVVERRVIVPSLAEQILYVRPYEDELTHESAAQLAEPVAAAFPVWLPDEDYDQWMGDNVLIIEENLDVAGAPDAPAERARFLQLAIAAHLVRANQINQECGCKPPLESEESLVAWCTVMAGLQMVVMDHVATELGLEADQALIDRILEPTVRLWLVAANRAELDASQILVQAATLGREFVGYHREQFGWEGLTEALLHAPIGLYAVANPAKHAARPGKLPPEEELFAGIAEMFTEEDRVWDYYSVDAWSLEEDLVPDDSSPRAAVLRAAVQEASGYGSDRESVRSNFEIYVLTLKDANFAGEIVAAREAEITKRVESAMRMFAKSVKPEFKDSDVYPAEIARMSRYQIDLPRRDPVTVLQILIADRGVVIGLTGTNLGIKKADWRSIIEMVFDRIPRRDSTKGTDDGGEVGGGD